MGYLLIVLGFLALSWFCIANTITLIQRLKIIDNWNTAGWPTYFQYKNVTYFEHLFRVVIFTNPYNLYKD